MRLFVTGASGFIGSAIVKKLQARGVDVLGLARSDASAEKLQHQSVQVIRGDLEDIASLRTAVEQSDGVIHAGYIHDFSRMDHAAAIDQQAILAMGEVLAGSNRPLVVTTGTALVSPGRLAIEQTQPVSGGHPRSDSNIAALAMADKGVRVSLVRLPPTVHGAGDHGFVPMIINMAKEKGAAVYIGDGSNRWPAVHRDDAAELFCLAAEKAEAGAILHAIQEEGIAFRQIAETIGTGLSLPVKSLTQEEAKAWLGWMAFFASVDNPASSEWTRQTFNWQPTGPGLLQDMREAGYFNK
ncbi:3-beta hydroxysteroid dehydrogenase [Pantoea rodasii]|uniref:3-beta hydroxysteroid dehydrogenase n=1 Tax=Pantoea rodasii TaxID=1076549 RepID=A0A0B1RBB3_9GAMM|nr:SDR family oxidoreductase [Pantoea rodasii]KHJ68390.1 3-beta hydroxysteroid dehydrogenase [Pantoea rodasii]